MIKRDYEIVGYNADMEEKNKVDHLLIVLRVKYQHKEQEYAKKNYSAGYSYKKEYLKVKRELRKLGIGIIERR